MKCPICGTACEENSKFCSGCGNDFNKNPMVEGNIDVVNKNGDLKFGPGVYIWFIICIVFQLNTILQLIDYRIYLMAIIGLLGILFNVLILLLKKRFCFYSLVVVVVGVFLANVFVYNVPIMTAIFGFLNPVISYAVLNKYWEYMK